MAGKASDALTAEVNLDVLRFDRGEHDEALRTSDGSSTFTTGRASFRPSELPAVGARRAGTSGVNDPQLFKDALQGLR